MALPPTIPTSFVPQSAANTTRRRRVDFVSAFNFLALGIFLVTLGLAVGVFLYSGVLSAQLNSKNEDLANNRKKIDTTLAHSFVRLHDRLASGQQLLDNHVALSNFFDTLGTVLPTTVRFSALHVSAGEQGKITIDGSGVAKNFNALAFASAEFARTGSIKDAIFSRLVVNKDNSVSFSLTASVDPKLVAFSATGLESEVAPALPEQPAATSTTP